MTLNREIWRLAIPAIISNITIPLLGLCDTTVAGHLGRTGYIGAVAVGAMMANSLFWLFGFLRMGTSGLTAQAFGAGDTSMIRRLLMQSIILGLVIGTLLIALRAPLGSLLISLMAPDTEIAPLASSYFHTILWGAPPMLATLAILGWMLGMQTTVGPMIVSIGTNLLNIALTVALVFGARWGFHGIALGTTTANWIGLIWALWLARRIMPDHKLWHRGDLVIQSDVMRRFFKVNGDIFFRSACVMLVSATVTATGSRIGALTLACNAVMMQFFSIFSYFMDGIAFTGEALCGRFAGEKNTIMLRHTIKALLMWGGIIMCVFTIAYWHGYSLFASFITNRPDVIAMVHQYSLWIKLIPPLTVGAFIFDGIFIGLTATRKMLIATAIAAIIFFTIAFVNIAAHGMTITLPDNNRLWIAFLSYLLARGVILGMLTPTVARLKFTYPH